MASANPQTDGFETDTDMVMQIIHLKHSPREDAYASVGGLEGFFSRFNYGMGLNAPAAAAPSRAKSTESLLLHQDDDMVGVYDRSDPMLLRTPASATSPYHALALFYRYRSCFNIGYRCFLNSVPLTRARHFVM